MSGILLLLTLLFSVASPFAPGMIAYTDFSSLQSRQVDAETLSQNNSLLPLDPRISSFTNNPETVPSKLELYTTLNVLYKAHGEPLRQYISAYDIRDKALLWRKTISTAQITGIELQANGSLVVCGIEITNDSLFCITFSDEGEYSFGDEIIISEVPVVIEEYKVLKKQEEERFKKVSRELLQKKTQRKLEQSLSYKLQQDETHKASTTTLETVISEKRKDAKLLPKLNIPAKKAPVILCKETGIESCIPNLTNQVLIQSEMIPIQVITSDVFYESETNSTTSIATEEQFLEEVVEVVEVIDENGPIEGVDGIFDYDDVVDYKTCFHMCYYVENSSWKKCSTNCNERF
jgi:hypothetical protein